MDTSKRKQQLMKQVEDFDLATRGLRDEIKQFERRKVEQNQVLAQLDTQYAKACRAEASGETNDRPGIEARQAKARAVISGLDGLVDEAQTKINDIIRQRDPVDRELNDILRAEHHQAMMDELAMHLEDGKKDELAVRALRKKISARVQNLRTGYRDPANPAIQAQASLVAEKLDNAHAGVRLREVFSQEEISSF